MTTKGANRIGNDDDKRLRALKAVLLFYQSANWAAQKDEWFRLTGREEASTVTLCDAVREAIDDTEGFKLKVGQVVVHVVNQGRPISDERMMIVGRRIEECVGGIQRWYCCRVCAPLHLNEVILLHTFEVVAIEDSENEKAT